MCLNKLFSTEQKQKSSQSGTSNTQNNLWDNPQLQQFMQGYNQQFSGAGGFNVPLNDYQTGAANQQQGVAAGLQPAQGVANTIGQQGISTADINRFMSPYIQSVVDPTIQAQNLQNQQALSNLRGNQAARGALGNNTGSEAAYMAGVQPAQQAQIASLYNQGYGQAVNTAGQSTGLQLQGASTAGGLANAATGANSALGTMGQNMWNSSYQNAMTPYTLYNQGVQGYQGFGNLAGQNTQTTGQSTGTTTSTPGLGQSIMGLAGMGMGLFGGGGFFPSMFPSVFGSGGYSGSAGKTGMRHGGAIPAYNSGGSVLPAFHGQQEDFASKVGKAFKAVQEMRRASGGRTEDKQDKGAGRFAEPRVNAWSTSVKPYHSERLPFELASAIPPYSAPRPLVLDLPRYDGGGAVLPSDWQSFGGFNANNSTEDAPSFGINPFAQFPAPAGGEFPSQGVIPPFNPGAATTSDVMEGYDPAAPSTQPGGGTRVASSTYRAPAPTFDPSSFVPERATLEPVHPHQRAAAWMMAASGPSVLGPGGEAMLKQHQENLNKYRVETEAANQANALQRQLMQHQADMAHRQEELGLRRDQLTETARHHQETEEAGNWVMDPVRGIMVNKKTGESRGAPAPTDFERRQTEARQIGLQPGTPEYNHYALTGKMPGTDIPPAQQTQLFELERSLQTSDGAVSAIRRAASLNDKSYSGAGARERAWIASQFGSEAAINTGDLNRLMMGSVLQQLKETFGANPTEGERKILLDVEGAVNATQEERKRILERARFLTETRQRFNRRMMDSIRNRTFTRNGVPEADPNELPVRPPLVPEGSAWNPRRRQWRDESGKIYDAEGEPVKEQPNG